MWGSDQEGNECAETGLDLSVVECIREEGVYGWKIDLKSMRAGQEFPSKNVKSAHKNTRKSRDDQRRLICQEGNHNKAGKRDWRIRSKSRRVCRIEIENMPEIPPQKRLTLHGSILINNVFWLEMLIARDIEAMKSIAWLEMSMFDYAKALVAWICCQGTSWRD